MTEQMLKDLIKAGFDYRQTKTISFIIDPTTDHDWDFDALYASCHLDMLLDGFANSSQTAPDK